MLASVGIIVLLQVLGTGAFLGDTVEESVWARHIFNLVDSDRDGSLTLAEVRVIYKRFDLNGDGHVTAGEFVKHWLADDIGNTDSGYRMFENMDTDKDGFFSREPDLTRTFSHFDRNGDGGVNVQEFVLTWTKLSL